MSFSRRAFVAGIAGGCASLWTAAARADSKLIRIIYPFGAGGSGDILTRFVAQKIGEALGRPSIVENRTGADGRIGIQSVKSAPADGSTLLISSAPSMTYMPLLHKTPGYDAGADFEPISQLGRYEFCIVAANDTGIKSVADLAKWVKANPTKATYSVPAVGSIPHFVGVELSKSFGVEMVRAPYRGSAAGLNDIIGGQLPLGLMPLSDAILQYRAGSVRMIAVMSRTRSPFVPEVETLMEAGYPIEAEAWFGLWAPARTPPETIQAIDRIVVTHWRNRRFASASWRWGSS